MWFKTVTTTLSKVILANTGQALPGIPGAGSGRISEWKEVPSGGEAPFEFTSGEKQRHKVSSWDGDLLEKCQLMSWNITVRFHRISRVRCAVVSLVETECVSLTNGQRQLFKTGYYPSIPSHPISSIPSHAIPSHTIHSSIPSFHPIASHPSHPIHLSIPPIHPINFSTHFFLISSF